jgi:hypothetical protein
VNANITGWDLREGGDGGAKQQGEH